MAELNLTVASKQTGVTRPKGSKSKGKPEGPEWAVLAETILNQTPGEWVLYEGFTQSHDAHRASTRLRDKDSYKAGKAFAPLQGRVELALVNTAIVDGKKIGDLHIQLVPEAPKPKRSRKS